MFAILGAPHPQSLFNVKIPAAPSVGNVHKLWGQFHSVSDGDRSTETAGYSNNDV